MAESTIARLQRERDEKKKDFDDCRQQRESVIVDRQRLQEESIQVQDALQRAISFGDVASAQAARTRIAEISRQREELQEVITSLAQRQSRLQHQFGEVHDRLAFAEKEVDRLARWIPHLRQELAKAHHTGAVHRIDSLRTDLEQSTARYFALTGERVLAEDVPDAA